MSQTLANQTVLVTGAAGFIGSHLVEALLVEGAKVIGIDNFITGRKQNLREIREHELSENFQFIEADVTTDPESYLLAEWDLDIVYHLASPASPPRYQANPIETYQANVWGSHLLLSHLRKFFPKAKYVFASSSEIYGEPEVHPQTESYWGNVNPNGVRSCYDEAKRMGETIGGVFERDFEIDVRIARIHNTYGPRMDPSDGRVVPNLLSQVLRREQLTIYGDGTQTRSFCFVADMVAGLMALGVKDGLKGATVNLGNPVEQTVLGAAKTIFELIRDQKLDESKLLFYPLPGDDPTRRRPDISRAEELLGWQPQTSFLEGMAQTAKYFNEVEGIGEPV